MNNQRFGQDLSNVDDILETHNRGSLVISDILHNVQEQYRHIPEHVVEYIASELGIATGDIYKEATYYSHWQI